MVQLQRPVPFLEDERLPRVDRGFQLHLVAGAGDGRGWRTTTAAARRSIPTIWAAITARSCSISDSLTTPRCIISRRCCSTAAEPGASCWADGPSLLCSRPIAERLLRRATSRVRRPRLSANLPPPAQPRPLKMRWGSRSIRGRPAPSTGLRDPTGLEPITRMV